MKQNVFLAVLLFTPGLRADPVVDASPETLTLDDCYARALAQSETVGLSLEEVTRAEAQYVALRSAVLPRVGFFGNDRFQDVTGVAGSGDASRRERRETGFYGRQTVFAGFREFAAMRAQTQKTEARRVDVDQARIRLYEDVVNIFFIVAERDRDIERLTRMRDVANDRVGDLLKRVAIGRSRESEVLSTESQLADLESRLEAARGVRSASLEVLSVLVGVPVLGVRDTVPDPNPPEPLSAYQTRLTNRPDLHAAQQEAEAARHLTDYARGFYWPTLNLSGNAYTGRTGANAESDWDVLFSLDAPIFTGGSTQGLVRTARSDERAARLRWSQIRRNAAREVGERYRALESYRAVAEKLERSARLAEKNYDVQRREYALGLVTNLDVLAAMNTWQEAGLAHERARLEAKRAALQLSLSVGEYPKAAP